jgi:hypothetical protein
MKKANNEMLDEYDFSDRKGIRGKYSSKIKDGYTVRIFDGEKVKETKHLAVIESDVHEYFPDSRAINKALRKLISLIPEKPAAR